MASVQVTELGFWRSLLLNGQQHVVNTHSLYSVLNDNSKNLGRVVCIRYHGEGVNGNGLYHQDGIVEFRGFKTLDDLTAAIVEFETARQFADSFVKWVHWKCEWRCVWIRAYYGMW